MSLFDTVNLKLSKPRSSSCEPCEPAGSALCRLPCDRALLVPEGVARWQVKDTANG